MARLKDQSQEDLKIHNPKETLNFKKAFAWTTFIGLLVLAGLLFYGDISKLGPTILHFNWYIFPLILCFTLFDDFLRFLKWDYFLSSVGVDLPKLDSARIFFSGLALSITPGKVGELGKSFLVKQLRDEPISKTTPVVVLERLTDLIAMVLLASAGAVYFRYGIYALVVVASVFTFFIIVVQDEGLFSLIIRGLSHVPFIQKYTSSIRIFYKNLKELLSFGRLTLAIGVSIVAWGSECIGMYLVFRGLGVDKGIIFSIFVFAFSSVMGAASMLPGGLIVAESSMTGIILALTGISKPIAVSATLLIRLSTLYFGVSIGLSTMALSWKRFGFNFSIKRLFKP